MRVRDLVVEGARAVPGPEARREAALLLRHVLMASDAWLLAHADDVLDPAKVDAFRRLLARRVRGEPVAYLIGSCGFHALELEVTPAVLIPRPETELLVELALARIPAGSPDEVTQRRNPGKLQHMSPDYAALHPGYAIADLGTGSGAIALAIAKAHPRDHVLATDASEPALEVAHRNAERLALGNITFERGDWCAALGDARFDMVVSNPPYIAEGDPHLGEGDLRFEPPLALSSGPDGLDAIRTIVRDAVAHLNDSGWLLFEHGFQQGALVRALLTRSGYRDVFTQRDLEGRERVSGGRSIGSL